MSSVGRPSGRRGDLSTEKTITNKIATVAALLRNDNFRATVGARTAGDFILWVALQGDMSA